VHLLDDDLGSVECGGELVWLSPERTENRVTAAREI
jgi:hypothetical protein